MPFPYSLAKRQDSSEDTTGESYTPEAPSQVDGSVTAPTDNETSNDEYEEERLELEEREKEPWYRKPSAWWSVHPITVTDIFFLNKMTFQGNWPGCTIHSHIIDDLCASHRCIYKPGM